jgi:thiol:disulfide interchange protein
VYLAFFEKKLGIRPIGKTLRWATALAVVFVGFTVGANRGTAGPGPTGGGRENKVAGEIDWRPYSDKLFKEAAKEGKPVVMDFTAEW